MSSTVFVKVKDLTADQRQWVAQMFGRQPAEDEQVTVILLPTERPATPMERQAVWQRIREILDKAAAHAQDVSEEEFEAAIEEAMAHSSRDCDEANHRERRVL